MKYNNNILFGLLTTVDGVRSNRWDMVLTIVNSIDKIKVLESKWEDWDYKNKNIEYYPLDLSKVHIWSTYDGKCIDLNFSVVGGDLICDVKIYNGELLDGSRKGLRFTAKLKLYRNFIKNLCGLIETKFNYFLNERYDEYLETQRMLWVNNLKDEFINHFNKIK